MRRLLIVVVVVVVAFAAGVAWLGVAQVPVLSSVFGMDRARDLGMERDKEAYQVLVDRYQIHLPSVAGNYTLSSSHHWSGSFEMDETVSEATIAAIREFSAPDSRIKDLQFRIRKDELELSAFVNVPGYPLSGPAYGRIGVTKTGPRSVRLDIRQLDFGRIGVPGNVADDVKNKLERYVNEKLAQANVRIDELQLLDGAVRFKGALPQTTEADPPEPNGLP